MESLQTDRKTKKRTIENDGGDSAPAKETHGSTGDGLDRSEPVGPLRNTGGHVRPH